MARLLLTVSSILPKNWQKYWKYVQLQKWTENDAKEQFFVRLTLESKLQKLQECVREIREYKSFFRVGLIRRSAARQWQWVTSHKISAFQPVPSVFDFNKNGLKMSKCKISRSKMSKRLFMLKICKNYTLLRDSEKETRHENRL